MSSKRAPIDLKLQFNLRAFLITVRFCDAVVNLFLRCDGPEISLKHADAHLTYSALKRRFVLPLPWKVTLTRTRAGKSLISC